MSIDTTKSKSEKRLPDEALTPVAGAGFIHGLQRLFAIEGEDKRREKPFNNCNEARSVFEKNYDLLVDFTSAYPFGYKGDDQYAPTNPQYASKIDKLKIRRENLTKAHEYLMNNNCNQTIPLTFEELVSEVF